MIDIIHARGDDACGMVAFYYRHRPRQGEPMDPSQAVLLDLTTPKPGDLVRCGSCQRLAEPAALVPEGGFA